MFILPVVEYHANGEQAQWKEAQVVVIWLSCTWETVDSTIYVRQLITPFLNGGSDKSAFLHPIGTSLSKAANTVKFVNL